MRITTKFYVALTYLAFIAALIGPRLVQAAPSNADIFKNDYVVAVGTAQEGVVVQIEAVKLEGLLMPHDAQEITVALVEKDGSVGRFMTVSRLGPASDLVINDRVLLLDANGLTRVIKKTYRSIQ